MRLNAVETLIAAQIAQVLHWVDRSVAEARDDARTREHRPANPSGFDA